MTAIHQAAQPATAAPSAPFPNGELRLFPRVFDSQLCQDWMAELTSGLVWHKDYHEFQGRRFHIPRLQAWVADADPQSRYSNNLLAAQPWHPPLTSIRREVETRVGHGFNAVLITWYRNGHDHVTWHADDDRELGEAPVIASLSLGASQTFQYQSRVDGSEGGLVLKEGDLLLMRPGFQSGWVHRVPMEPEIEGGRINLTFRRVMG